MVLEPVEQVEASGVSQAHDRHGDERLRDGAHPVLRVGVGGLAPGPAVERADGVGPGERTVPHDARSDRRQAAAALLGREQVVQVAGGRGVDRAGKGGGVGDAVRIAARVGAHPLHPRAGLSGVAQTTPAGWDGGPTVADHRIS